MVSLLNKWLIISLLGVLLVSGKPIPHPLHVSVIEINHNAGEKTLEISCKIFTDDFEKILRQNYKAKVDLINPPDKNAMDSLVKKYVLSHLALKANNQPVQYHYLGFEHEAEAVFCYIEVNNVPSLTKLEVSSNLMYDLFDDQMNILHVTVNGKRKSDKLDYPKKETSFVF